MDDARARDGLEGLQAIVNPDFAEALEVGLQAIESLTQLRANLGGAKTQTEVIESFYAVALSAEQNRAIADAARALKVLAEIRRMVSEADESEDCRIDVDVIRGALELKPCPSR